MSRAYVDLIATAVINAAEAARAAGGMIGVRLSPVDLAADEAGPLAAAIRAALPWGDRVAVAAPGARAEEGAGWLVGSGDEVAQRATHWRNSVGQRDLVVYVSAERLGRAGGLEDTLRPVTDADLTDALSAALAGSGLPDELVQALTSLELLGPDRPRQAARFIDAAAGADVAACGALLPLLGLMPDDALGEAVLKRLEHNQRVVNLARDGRRPQGEGPTAELRRALAEPLLRHGDAGVAQVNLGQYSLEVLEGDLPKAAARKPRVVALVSAPARPAPKPARASAPAEVKAKPSAPRPAKTSGAAPSRSAGAAAAPAHSSFNVHPAPPAPAPLTAPAAPSGADTGATPPVDVDTRAMTAPVEAPASVPVTDTPAEPTEQAALPTGRGDAAPPEPEARELGADVALRPGDEATAATDTPAQAAEAPGATPAEPAAPRPRAARARRSPPAPWSAELQRAERPPRPRPPAGLVELLTAGLGAGGDALEWPCAGDPGAVTVALPKGLRPADRRPGSSGAAWEAWTEARAALIEAALTAHQPSGEPMEPHALVEALIDAPHTVLGAPDVAELAERAAAAGRLVLAEARAEGPDAMDAALGMETVTLRSANGQVVVALGPLHPVLLCQALERLDTAARAARLTPGAARAALAAWADRPPSVPMCWAGQLPYTGGPRWAPCFGAKLPLGASVGDLIPALVGSFLAVHPHAAHALRVRAHEAAAQVAEGVSEALATSPAADHATAVIEGAALRGADLGERAAARVRLEPSDAQVPPHIELRRAAPGPAAPVEAPACAADLCAGPWRAAVVAATPLAAACEPLPGSGRTWLAVLGGQLTGPPPARWTIIARADCGPDELVVLTREVDPLAEHLRAAMGIAAGRARDARVRLQELCAPNLGIIALDGAGSPALSAGTASREALAQLGPDARLLHLDAELRTALFGGARGALAVAVELSKQGPRYAFGAHDQKLPKERWATEPLKHAAELVTLAEGRGHVAEAAEAVLRAAGALP
ncbi:MAG: hypothetical protein JNM72_27440 [Deltaproteobacteria bacterium]|nr:hypothetical protein [Deltaproteobacteria bacterium]